MPLLSVLLNSRRANRWTSTDIDLQKLLQGRPLSCTRNSNCLRGEPRIIPFADAGVVSSSPSGNSHIRQQCQLFELIRQPLLQGTPIFDHPRLDISIRFRVIPIDQHIVAGATHVGIQLGYGWGRC